MLFFAPPAAHQLFDAFAVPAFVCPQNFDPSADVIRPEAHEHIFHIVNALTSLPGILG